ncbi:transmembrane protein 53-like [Centruroides sculpturatus]|uniref:transmembrane protein 53-like n=1 Tax=Centruroides sculpturatus TaxID=218467 RepID=UPI000C6E9DF1|nr:transmembrane protein 53-like [Centruroides sculpturatus]
MEDNFEYDIRFSSNACLSSDEVLRGKYDIILREEPVIVLLGWGGCKEHHLSKYSTIYGKHGCTTLMYIAPLEMLISINSRKMLASNAIKLVNLLEDMDLIEKPLFFHCFSNGGALMYDLMRETLLKRDEVYNIRGCIFDSSPAEFGLSYIFKMLSIIFPIETFR